MDEKQEYFESKRKKKYRRIYKKGREIFKKHLG